MYLMCQMCSATLAILVEARRLRHLFIGSTLPSTDSPSLPAVVSATYVSSAAPFVKPTLPSTCNQRTKNSSPLPAVVSVT